MNATARQVLETELERAQFACRSAASNLEQAEKERAFCYTHWSRLVDRVEALKAELGL